MRSDRPTRLRNGLSDSRRSHPIVAAGLLGSIADHDCKARHKMPAAPHAKAFYPAFTSPVTGLNAGRHAQFGLRPHYGTKNQPLSARLLETRLRFLDRGMLFQRSSEDGLEGNRASAMQNR